MASALGSFRYRVAASSTPLDRARRGGGTSGQACAEVDKPAPALQYGDVSADARAAGDGEPNLPDRQKYALPRVEKVIVASGHDQHVAVFERLDTPRASPAVDHSVLRVVEVREGGRRLDEQEEVPAGQLPEYLLSGRLHEYGEVAVALSHEAVVDRIGGSRRGGLGGRDYDHGQQGHRQDH